MTAIQNLHVQLYMKRKLNIFTSLKCGKVTVGILLSSFMVVLKACVPIRLIYCALLMIKKCKHV